MVKAFEHELQLGLESHADEPNYWRPELCSFKMLDSCVRDLPSGKETGVSWFLVF